MSIYIECPECEDGFEVGLTDTGIRPCKSCETEIDIGERTLSGSEKRTFDGVDEPAEGMKVVVYPNDDGVIEQVIGDGYVIVSTATGKQLYKTQNIEEI
jgi:hypothetical protein